MMSAVSETHTLLWGFVLVRSRPSISVPDGLFLLNQYDEDPRLIHFRSAFILHQFNQFYYRCLGEMWLVIKFVLFEYISPAIWEILMLHRKVVNSNKFRIYPYICVYKKQKVYVPQNILSADAIVPKFCTNPFKQPRKCKGSYQFRSRL